VIKRTDCATITQATFCYSNLLQQAQQTKTNRKKCIIQPSIVLHHHDVWWHKKLYATVKEQLFE